VPKTRQSGQHPDRETQTLHRPTKFPPLFTRLAAALLLAVLAPPGVAGGLVGPGACESHAPGVTPLDTTWKGCGGFRDCIVGWSGLRHNSIVYAVLDFKRSEYPGPVRVAVLSNDSRVPTATPMMSLPLGELQEGAHSPAGTCPSPVSRLPITMRG